MTCTLVEHTVPVVVTSDDCNADPVIVTAVENTSVLIESAPEVIEVNAGPRGLQGDKGDKGDPGPPGEVPEAPSDGTAYARQNAAWVAALPATARGASNGVAPLVAGKIPESHLPAIAITDVFQVASQAAMLALVAERGDLAVRSDLNKSFALAAEPASTLANWVELRTPTNAVLSVAGKTGAVALVTSDIGGLSADLAAKQPTLVSGSTIKTVAGQSLLGSGDIPVGGALPSATTIARSNGRVTSVTEDGVTTSITYHPDGRVNTVSYPRGALTRTETYTYTNGVLTGMTASEA